MSANQNYIYNNSLSSMIDHAGPKIVKAIRTASASTGVNFSYLMEKASVESSFQPTAKARTSSATGLFQFIDKTWMSMVKKYGDKYGLGTLANKIDDNGRCADRATRNKILSLRNDPEKAACLAAEYAAENKNYLEQHTSANVGSTELYMAHFMGASGATDFLNALEVNPDANAARLFPKAAASNRNVFFDSATGKPRTLQGVYDFFAQKFTGSADEPVMTAAADETGIAASSATDAPTQLAAAYPVIHARDIVWNTPDPRRELIRMLGDASESGRSGMPSARTAMTANPVDIMMMAQLDLPGSGNSYNR